MDAHGAAANLARSFGWARRHRELFETRHDVKFAYDLPDDVADRVWEGRFRGQRQKWFAVRFTGVDSDVALGAAPKPEFSDWKWVVIEFLPETVIAFKRAVYERLVAEFRPIVESIRAGRRGES